MKKLLSFSVLILLLIPAGAKLTWKQRASNPANARHRCIAFSIGNKGYFGLGHHNAGPAGNTLYEDIWEYDAANNSWTQKADYLHGPTYHSSCFVVSNIAYVGLGQDSPFSSFTNAFYSYNPATNTWAPIASFPGTPRRGGVGFAIDAFGYVGTGNGNNDFYRYDPSLDSWSFISPLPVGKQSAVAFSIGGKGYVGTGSSSNDFYEYNPATNSWTPRANVGGFAQRQEACGFAMNGKGYIGTGDNFSSGTNYGDFWEYDPGSNTWTQIEDFSGNARRYMVAFVIGDKAFCGSGTNGTNFNDLWELSENAVGFEQLSERLDVTFFPNPMINEATLDISGFVHEDLLELQILDITGKVIEQGPIGSSRTILKRDDKQAGIYIYRVLSGDEVVKQDKFVVL